MNLEPAFQRYSVWSMADRRLLVNSIFDSIPMPSVYLYRRIGKGGRPIYDVIDGKQRIETILAFMKKGPVYRQRNPVTARRKFSDEDSVQDWRWSDLSGSEKNFFLTTQVPVIEVEGEFSEIVELFVRINSTGKKLTSQERRKALYYKSSILRKAQNVSNQLKSSLIRTGVLSHSQIVRMKHVELVLELMLSIDAGMPLNKKKKIDEIIRGENLSAASISEAAKELRASINVARAILPNLRTTRFHRVADFYSLVLLLASYRAEGLSINSRNSKQNKLAGSLLEKFGATVDEVNDLIGRGKGVPSEKSKYQEYLQTVKEGTDSKSQREKREKILRELLDGVFAELDQQRVFNTTQRRILWHGSEKKKCKICGKRIHSWNDLAIDHMYAWCRGGRTNLANAGIVHRTCNSQKGAKVKRQRKSVKRKRPGTRLRS
jgi:5-methylcytosine-specific restriction endonuclease McrA